MVSSLRTFIEAQIRTYMPKSDGYVIEFREEDPASTSLDYEGRINSHSVEWIYRFKIVLKYFAGDKNTKTRTDFDTAFESYRKAVAGQWAKNTRLTTIETDEDVYVNSIDNYIRRTDAKYYINEYTIEYKHIERY